MSEDKAAVGSWRDLPLPLPMQKLPKDHRGYPVPYIVLSDNNGKPWFQFNDDTKVEECLRDHKCSICGSHMDPTDRWLIGGPLSAFHPYGVYADAPMHHICIEYAMRTCPYLAQRITTHIDLSKVTDKMEFGDRSVTLVQTISSVSEVPFFVAVRPIGYGIKRNIIDGIPTRSIVPTSKAYLKTEFYHKGILQTREQEDELVTSWLARVTGTESFIDSKPQIV